VSRRSKNGDGMIAYLGVVERSRITSFKARHNETETDYSSQDAANLDLLGEDGL